MHVPVGRLTNEPVIFISDVFRFIFVSFVVRPTADAVGYRLAHRRGPALFGKIQSRRPAGDRLTQSLKQALTLVDIRTLDHFVIAGSQLVSLAERALI